MEDRPDHDQRFKSLLQEFIGEFFLLFFPAWAERFDFHRIDWLTNEVFVNPPAGARRYLDLVAKLPARQEIEAKEPGNWMALIHVELESGEAAAPFRPRMFDYYTHLRRSYDLPVLPIALFLRVGLEGVGVDVYEERFWEFRPLLFEYLYVGLPRLDALPFLEGNNWLGVALSALMKIPLGKRPWVKAEALRRLVSCPENDQRRYLLCECVQAYMPLEPPELSEFQHLLVTPPYQEVRRMQATWFEQGKQQGEIAGQRRLLVRQLEQRFGPLSRSARERLDSMSAEALDELALAVLSARSFEELGLAD